MAPAALVDLHGRGNAWAPARRPALEMERDATGTAKLGARRYRRVPRRAEAPPGCSSTSYPSRFGVTCQSPSATSLGRRWLRDQSRSRLKAKGAATGRIFSFYYWPTTCEPAP